MGNTGSAASVPPVAAGTEHLHALKQEIAVLDVAFIAECYERVIQALAPLPAATLQARPRSRSAPSRGSKRAKTPTATGAATLNASTPAARAVQTRLTQFQWARGVTRSGTRYAADDATPPVLDMTAADASPVIRPTTATYIYDTTLSRSQFADVFTVNRMVSAAGDSTSLARAGRASAPLTQPNPELYGRVANTSGLEAVHLSTLRLSFLVFDTLAVIRMPRPVKHDVILPPPPPLPRLEPPSPSRSPKGKAFFMRAPSLRNVVRSGSMTRSSSFDGEDSSQHTGRGSMQRSPSEADASPLHTGRSSSPRRVAPMRRAASLSGARPDADIAAAATLAASARRAEAVALQAGAAAHAQMMNSASPSSEAPPQSPSVSSPISDGDQTMNQGASPSSNVSDAAGNASPVLLSAPTSDSSKLPAPIAIAIASPAADTADVTSELEADISAAAVGLVEPLGGNSPSPDHMQRRRPSISSVQMDIHPMSPAHRSAAANGHTGSSEGKELYAPTGYVRRPSLAGAPRLGLPIMETIEQPATLSIQPPRSPAAAAHVGVGARTPSAAALQQRRPSRTLAPGSFGHTRRPSHDATGATRREAAATHRVSDAAAMEEEPEVEPDPELEAAAQMALEDDLRAQERMMMLKTGAPVGQEFFMLTLNNAAAGAAKSPRTRLRHIAARAGGVPSSKIADGKRPAPSHAAAASPVAPAAAAAHATGVADPGTKASPRVRIGHTSPRVSVPSAALPAPQVVTTYQWLTDDPIMLFHRLHVEGPQLVAPPTGMSAAVMAASKERKTSLKRASDAASGRSKAGQPEGTKRSSRVSQSLPVAVEAARLLATCPDPRVIEEAVRRATSVISTPEVFTLLLLYTSGSVEEKAVVAYKIFAHMSAVSSAAPAQGSHLLTLGALRILVCNTLCVWYTLCELAVPPSNMLVEAVLADLLAGMDGTEVTPHDYGALASPSPTGSVDAFRPGPAAAPPAAPPAVGRVQIQRLSIGSPLPSAGSAPLTHASSSGGFSTQSGPRRSLTDSRLPSSTIVPLPTFVRWLGTLQGGNHTPRVVNAYVALCAELQRPFLQQRAEGDALASTRRRQLLAQTSSASFLGASGTVSARIPFSSRRSGQELYAMSNFDADARVELDPATSQLLQTQIAQLLMAVYLHGDYAGARGFARAMASVGSMRACAARARVQVVQCRRDPRVAMKIGPVSTGVPAGAIVHVHTNAGTGAGARRTSAMASAAAAAATSDLFNRMSAGGDAASTCTAAGLSLEAMWFKLLIAAESPWQVGKQTILPAAAQQHLALTPFAVSMHDSRVLLQTIASGKPGVVDGPMTARLAAAAAASAAPATARAGGKASVGAGKTKRADAARSKSTAARAASLKPAKSVTEELFGDLSLRSPRSRMAAGAAAAAAAAKSGHKDANHRAALSPTAMTAPRLSHLAFTYEPASSPAGSMASYARSSLSSIADSDGEGSGSDSRPRRRRRSSMVSVNLSKMEKDFALVAASLSKAANQMESAELIAEGIDVRDPLKVAERRAALRRKFRRTMARAAAMGKVFNVFSAAPLAAHHANVRNLGGMVSSIMTSPRDAGHTSRARSRGSGATLAPIDKARSRAVAHAQATHNHERPHVAADAEVPRVAVVSRGTRGKTTLSPLRSVSRAYSTAGADAAVARIVSTGADMLPSPRVFVRAAPPPWWKQGTPPSGAARHGDALSPLPPVRTPATGVPPSRALSNATPAAMQLFTEFALQGSSGGGSDGGSDGDVV